VRRAVWISALTGLGALVPLGPLTAAGANAGAATVAARPSAGCAVTPAVAPGTSDQLLAAAGDNGSYVREIPPSYTGRVPVPVVIDLHGYSEPAQLQAQLSGLGTYGDSHGFVTITPQVADPVPMWQTGFKSNDVAFIGALLHTVDATLCADRNRIYVTGYSNGAFLTSTIACVYASQVAAVAPVAGLENPSGCHPVRPVPIVAFHGTADPFVSYTGGLGPSSLKLPAPDGSGRTIGQELGKNAAKERIGPSIPVITADWAKRDGCAAGPTSTAVATGVTRIAYSCSGGNEVELYRVTGGGHAWPGSALSQAVASVVGPTTMAISADQIMWSFFAAHPLRS
jgi:polyhydroxybutyrate depolymerase